MNFEQVGIYTCLTSKDFFQQDASITLNVTLPVRIVEHSPPTKVPIHQKATLWCLIDGYPINTLHWYTDTSNSKILANNTLVDSLNNTLKKITLNLEDLKHKDTGNYTCQVTGGANDEKAAGRISLKILDKPQVQIDHVKALGSNIIYLNWTVSDGNDPTNLEYEIQYMEDETSNWFFYPEKISGPAKHAVLENKAFKNNTGYSLRMRAKNKQGESQNSNIVKIKTLSKTPEFVPEVKVTGVTVSSITISWTPLPSDLLEHIHYYQLKLLSSNRNKSIEAIHSALNGHLYMFKDLASATTYEFQVFLTFDLFLLELNIN